MTNPFRTEPVAVTGSIVAAVAATLSALVSFHVVHFSAEQITSAVGAVTAVLGIPTVIYVRSQVTPINVEAPEAGGVDTFKA